MNHGTMRQMISALVDGELAEPDRETVRLHIGQCTACRSYEQGLRSLRAGIRESATMTLPDRFPQRVLRAVRKDDEEVLSWFPAEQTARRLVAGLAFVAAVFVGFASASRPAEPVLIEPYLTGEPSDSSVTRMLLNKETISKDDVLLAAVTRN